MIPALRRRLSRALHVLGNAIGPDRWLPAPSPADEYESLRRELQAETKAEFGLRNVEFGPWFLVKPGEAREILPAPGPGKAWVWNGRQPAWSVVNWDLVDATDNVLPMKERK